MQPSYSELGETPITEQTEMAENLYDNIDNLKSVIKDYNGFLGKVFEGAHDKASILAESRNTGFHKLGNAIENYLANLEDKSELNRVKELLGVDMPEQRFKIYGAMLTPK